MAKHLNVNVAVTADTSAAKAQLQSLQSTLSQLSTSSTNLHLGLNTSELNKAISDVDKLQAHLKNATNSSGLLDFSKLNNSIKASGSSLTEYGNQLLKLGPQGQQAFNQLTQAISKSEVPMSRMKGLLGEFGTVLGNTIKWQAASSAIHGMMGSIQHAFSYAQQLNKSLNNIQIVTQATDEHMAKFAESANKAAKQLNTTTTQYTNASLIYYQQGLNDKQVAERTAATIKMANASGQSAEKVSNQMTAIWNNFDNGTKSLEYYADVITALGAATASSSEEIATGLQKFASVADTVGLSYENATAALATITAQTRQSADSVGTGLRTLFARLQSLNLGETLDDGVTLSKYSKALDTIGVKVIDMSGNLRKADDILMDMGNKWQELSSAQKAAVAQTVGGVRQYTTIMALMDNFDEYLENVKIATNSEGTVQAQADIYAKSWEAAQKRVKAASESIYSDLIDDKFFISLNNGFADFLNILDQIINGLGGLRTLIPMIGAALTAAFSDKMTMGLINVGNTLRSLTPGAAQRDRAERDAFLDNAIKIQTGYSSKDYAKLSVDQRQQYDYAKRDLEIQRTYAKNSPYMTNLDRMIAQTAMDKYSNLRNAYTQTASSLSASQFNQAQARIDMTGFKGTPFDIYTKKNQMGEAGKTALRQAQQYYSMAANNPKSPNGPKYFTDTIYDAQKNVINPNQIWFSNNGQFQKSTYDKMLQESGDVNTLTTGINDRQNQINILKDLEASGKGAIGIKELAKAGLFESNAEAAKYLKDKGIFDPSQNKNIDMSALRQEISSLTEDQDQMVTDFAAKWGKSKEAVMKYKDAIIATNGSLKKQEELKKQMDQADKEAAEATKKNQQVQRAQDVVKFAQAMQSAVAAGSSFAAVTENIRTNLENGGSVFDNFGSTLSGVTSGFMSAAMTMAAIPGPAGIAIAVISTLIGVLSQIPEVTDFVHKIFTSEDKLALEQAQEATKQIQEDFEEAKQKAAEFLDATGTHNNLLEQINQCTKGTEEFKQAVIDANLYAKQMMQDFSLSLDDFTKDESGALVLKDGVKQQRQAALEAQRDNLELMNAYSQYEVQRQQYAIAEKSLDSILNGNSSGLVYANHETKENHTWTSGYDMQSTMQDIINEYISEGVSDSFETYYKNRGGDTSWGTSYRRLSKEIANLGYSSVDEYIQAGKQYGSASSLKFDGIVSDLFKNIATSQVFNEDKDLDISNFLSSYLGTAKNGELIRDASLQDYFKNTDIDTRNNLQTAFQKNGVDITQSWEQLFENETALRTFLEVAGNFDAANLANMDKKQLQAEAKSFVSAQKGLEIFQKNYDILTKDAGVQLLAKIGEKKQSEQKTTAQEAQQRLKEFEKSGEVLSEQDQLLRDYYENWIKDYEQAKETMVQSAVDLFTNDELYKINETDTDKQKADKEQAQKDLKEALTSIISNSSLTDEEVAEALNLGQQMKNVLGEAFSPYEFSDFFNKSKTDMTSMYRSIDWSSQVSAFFDVARIKERIGNTGTEVAQEINRLYDTLLDDKHLNGKSGLFSQIFQEEDFQKELKDVQKEFKKTGKISTDSINDIADSCEHLNEALDNGVYSAGAVADALELYAMGAITDIEDIKNGLWSALEAANAFKDVLQDAFDYIDSWSPDRSVSDIANHVASVYKDYSSEMGTGNFGSERVYQDAAEMWNQNYSDALRRHLITSQKKNANNPAGLQSDYDQMFSMYDAAYEEAKKTGNNGPLWSLMTNSAYDAQNKEILGFNSEDLAGIGLTRGSDGTDIEIDTQGRTSKEFTQQLAEQMHLTYEQAEMWAAEIMGHDATASQDFRTQDFMAGLSEAQKAQANGEAGAVDKFLRAQANDVDVGLMSESLQRQMQSVDEKYNSGQMSEEEATAEYARLMKQQQALKEYEEQLTDIQDEQTKLSQSGKDVTQTWEGLSETSKNTLKEVAESSKIEGTDLKDAKEIYDRMADMGITDAEEQQKALNQLGISAKDLGGTYTDEFGNMQEVTMQEGETLEQFQERLNSLETTAKNKKLGKDLVQGFVEGIQELVENGENLDGFEKLLEPLKGLENLSAENISQVAEAFNKLKEDLAGLDTSKLTELEALLQRISALASSMQLNINTSIDPPKEDVHHLRDDFQDMQNMADLQVDIKFGEEDGINKIKENKGIIDDLKNNANILVTITGPDDGEVGKIQGIVNQINEMNPTLKVTVVKVDESGNPIGAYTYDPTTGDKTFEGANGATVKTNDSYFASAWQDNDRARATAGLYWEDNSYHGGDKYYDQNGNYTGFTYEQVANGELEVGLTDSSIQAVGEATGEATAQEMQPSGAQGIQVNHQGDNKVTVDGKDYNLEGSNYDSKTIENMVANLAAAQKTSIDGSASSEERVNAQTQVEQLTASLQSIISEIQSSIKPEPSENNSEGATGETSTSGETNISAGGASVQIPGEIVAESVNTDGVETPQVEAELVAEGDVEGAEDGTTVTVDAEKGNVDQVISEVESQAKSADATITINGDNGPAISAVNAAVGYANSASGTIKIGGNNSGAMSAIDQVEQRCATGFTVNVTVNASALGAAVEAAAAGSEAVRMMALHKKKCTHSDCSGACAGSEEYFQCANGVTAGSVKNENYCGNAGTGSTAAGAHIQSFVNGSANRHVAAGPSLVGEEGAEIVWNKQEGYAYIVGADHPQFAMLRPGDRVFNANDTRKILGYDRPKSNWSSPILDPTSMASGGLLGSYAYGGIETGGGGGKGGRSKGGGGGDGDSGYQSYEPNRYHLIERQISDLTFWYDELSKAKDKAYGTNRLRYIDKEIEATNELITANKALLAEAEAYREQDLQTMRDLGIDFELDENGNIKNYEELEELYRRTAETSDDDAEKDAAQEAWDAIERYEETLDKIKDVRQEISDQVYELANQRLEKITLKAELRIDFDDREINFVQHFIDKLDGNIYKTSDRLAKMGTQMGLITDKIQTSRNAINEIFAGMTDAYGNKLNLTYEQWLNMSEAEREALNINGDYGAQLEEMSDKILDYIDALEEYKMKGVEALTAAFAELNTAVTDQISLFDHYSNMLSSLRDITDLQNIKLPKEFRDTIKTLNKTMVDVSKDRIKSQQDYYNELNNEANALQDKINNTSDYDLKKAYQDQLDDIKSQMRDTMEDVLSTYQDALSKAKELYDETMEWIKEDYESSLSDLYNSTSLIQDAFDRKKALSEQYVDDYEKYYQLGKLQRQINKDIDNAAVNGNKANKNLKKLLEEIQTLQENGAQLSAYDLDILEKKYEYEKALADLEDARNAKQTVRLQRDRNGNWGYVYTAADSDELAEQEQAVEDKLYEYTKAATEQSKDLQGQILSLWAEAGDKIAQMRADGVSEDVIDDYIADTQQKLSFLMAQLEKTGADVSLYLPKWLSLTNDSFNLTTDTFKETILSMVTGMDNIGQVGKKISDAILTITEATREAVEQYNITIDALNKLVSGNTNFKKQVEEWARAIGDASKENVKNTKEALDNMSKTFSDVLTAAKAFEKEFMTVYEPIIKRNEDFLSGLLAALDALNKKNYGTADLSQSNVITPPNTSSSGTSTPSSSNGLGIYGRPSSYDTGGYTGSWGSDGKLAFLHEKEEIFNKYDTENLLTAANILRTLDMQTGNFERGLGEFFNPSVKDNKQTLEQEVYITAEFPNATSHSEIEEAFNNLANRATQYANRKVG